MVELGWKAAVHFTAASWARANWLSFVAEARAILRALPPRSHEAWHGAYDHMQFCRWLLSTPPDDVLATSILRLLDRLRRLRSAAKKRRKGT